jgi:hypothetical protein
MRSEYVGATTLAILLSAVSIPGGEKDTSRSNAYVVQMSADPVVAYEGGSRLPGHVAKGQKIDLTDPRVARYAAHLDARHDEALASVGRPPASTTERVQRLRRRAVGRTAGCSRP